MKTEEEKATVSEVSAGTSARRRFIRGAAAAPVLLVSGRSALACNPGTDKCALSPMAWMSFHPQSENVGVKISHEVGCNFLGLSPGFWKPNKSGRTFQSPTGNATTWPTGVAPFQELVWHRKKKDGTIIEVRKAWDPSKGLTYSNLPYNDPLDPTKDAGWDTGSKLPFYSTKSISRILIDEPGTVLWHLCAAYLNAKTWPSTYALTEEEISNLYHSRRLVAGGRELSNHEINEFLDQTWT